MAFILVDIFAGVLDLSLYDTPSDIIYKLKQRQKKRSTLKYKKCNRIFKRLRCESIDEKNTTFRNGYRAVN